MSKNISYLSGRKGIENGLFDRINADVLNKHDPDSIKNLSREFLIGSSSIRGAISFYDFLDKQKSDNKPKICNGTSCLLAGTQKSVRKTLENHYEKNEIGEITCLGRCYENSAFKIGHSNYSGSDINRIREIKAKEVFGHADYHISSDPSCSILTQPDFKIDELQDLFHNVLNKDYSTLLDEIQSSKLRGRGGAGFPIALKLASLKKQVATKKFVVCNGDEGDPGSFSDRFLLEKRPMFVLAGMFVAALVSGADTGILYIRYEYPESIRRIKEAVASLEKAGLIGENILDSDFSLTFKIVEGAGSYICGEETALLSSIEGQRPEVRIRPPFPTESGLFNLPTLVNNVETFASLPWIAINGGSKFAAIGTDGSTGTKLLSLDSFFNCPGIVEIPMGTPLTTVINDYGKGFKREIKALHIGGPLGGLVPSSLFEELNISFESFTGSGFDLGHASIIAIPSDFPLIEYIHHLFEFCAHESCGKCFPCRLGSVRGKEMLREAIENKNMQIDAILFDDLLDTLEKGSLCGLGSALPHPIRHALKYFHDELEPYFSNSQKALKS